MSTFVRDVRLDVGQARSQAMMIKRKLPYVTSSSGSSLKSLRSLSTGKAPDALFKKIARTRAVYQDDIKSIRKQWANEYKAAETTKELERK